VREQKTMNFRPIKFKAGSNEGLMMQLTRLQRSIISTCMSMRDFCLHSNN